MKIRRTIDGKEIEIELTSDELYEAFVEQQAAFDLEDVRFYFADYTEKDFQREYGMTRAEAEDLFESVALHLRRNIDKYDMMFEYALPAAAEEVFVAQHKWDVGYIEDLAKRYDGDDEDYCSLFDRIESDQDFCSKVAFKYRKYIEDSISGETEFDCLVDACKSIVRSEQKPAGGFHENQTHNRRL